MPKQLFFSENLKFLRESKELTQAQMQEQLGIKRTTWNGYEKGGSQPYMDVLMQIAEYFDISVDDLLFRDLAHVNLNAKSKNRENVNLNVNPTVNLKGENGHEDPDFNYTDESPPAVLKKGSKKPQLMPKVITINSHGEENAVYVPVKARAGYLLGYGDPVFMEKLPAYNLPGLRHGTYRIFEVDGLSMFNTLQDKDKVIARWVQPSEIRDDRIHVLITKNDGLLIKRVINRLEEGKLICKSDNNHHGQYPNLVLDASEVLEAWYVVERWTRQLPSPGEIYKRIVDLEADMAILKQKMMKA